MSQALAAGQTVNVAVVDSARSPIPNTTIHWVDADGSAVRSVEGAGGFASLKDVLGNKGTFEISWTGGSTAIDVALPDDDEVSVVIVVSGGVARAEFVQGMEFGAGSAFPGTQSLTKLSGLGRVSYTVERGTSSVSEVNANRVIDCPDSVYSNTGYDAASNALSNGRDGALIRWIVEDVTFAAATNVTGFRWAGNEPLAFNWSGQLADYIILNADGPGGTPGTLVTQVMDVPATRINTGDILFGDPVWQYTITGINEALPAGTYWIGMRVVQSLPLGPGSFDRGWWVTAQPDGTSECYLDYGPNAPGWDPGNVVFGGTPYYMAFCVFGFQGDPPYGACCDDLTGTCTDCVQGDCPPPNRFAANTTCADLTPACGEVTGACCDLVLGGCTEVTPAACAMAGGQYQGNFTTCTPDPCPCVVPCPQGGLPEGEPMCGPDYDDQFNGGCNSPVIDPNASNCCFDHGTPGCDDAACQATVCALDSFCCNTAWDGLCADAAIDLCGGLCQIAFPYFSPINLGDTVCGEGGTFTFGADQFRDTDWYKITLADYTQLTWAVEAEFPVLFGIVDTGGVDDCTQVSAFLVSATADECQPGSVTACLGPGTWYLFVAPSVFTDVDCDADYTATVTGGPCPEGACCNEGVCDVFNLIECNAAGGSWLGEGTDCDPNPCPQNDDCDVAEALPLDTVVAASNVAGTTDVTPTCGTTTPTNGLWYEVVGNGETLTASTCLPGTDFDTKIQVFCYCDPLLCVGGNDDAAGAPPECSLNGLNRKSRVTWCSEVGKTYYILVGGFSGAVGNFELEVTSSGACAPNFNCTIPTGACCDGATCLATNTQSECAGLGGQWFVGETCPAFACPVPCDNETCGLAAVVASVPYSNQCDNNFNLPSPPPGSCNSGAATVMQNDAWWSYTPQADCLLSFSVDYSLNQGSNYDGLTAIYSGPNCNSLTELQCLDSGFGAADADATVFLATGGTTYWFQVGDWGTGEQGGPTLVNIDCSPVNVTGACCQANGSCQELNVADCAALPGSYQGDGSTCTPNPCPQPPPNDDCVNAEPLSVPGSVIVDNSLASNDPQSQPTCGTGAVNKAVWYSVVGDGTTFTASTCNPGGNFADTKIQVWCVNCSIPTCVAGNDDAACGISGLRSTVSWCTDPGETYLIAVGGFGANAGVIDLSVASGAACGSPPNCALPTEYCLANATDPADSLCAEVNLDGNINNTAGVCATYSDFTGSVLTTLTQGQTYPLSVTSGTCGGCFGKWTKVYIDFNGDLGFGIDELVLTSVASSGGTCPHTVSGNFTVPAGAALGNTRMRVVVREGGSAASTQACGTFTWGEVEDYTVEIAAGGPLSGGGPWDDNDGDGIPNFCDNCPDDFNEDQADADGDGNGDPCDLCPGFDDYADADGDGVPDGCDICPGFDDNADADNDGTPDGCDGCPLDPGKIDPGQCGCGVPYDDTDADGVADCIDGCPDDPNKIEPGICGCGVAETGDSDGDGVADCVDQCPGVDDAVFAPGCEGAIPTMSQWGLVVLAMLLLIGGKLYFGRRTAVVG